ncbi:hypothetical protein KY316_02465, partial [Candidatus Woesearchaeota archaeon]|nr:hypothetical protein [Candidatus Woesearchaeota archaeon]
MAGQQLSRIFLPNKTRRDLRDKMQVIESNVPLLKIYRIIVLLSLVSAIGLGVYSFFMPSFEFYRLFNKIVLFISVIVISFFIIVTSSRFHEILDIRSLILPPALSPSLRRLTALFNNFESYLFANLLR